MRAARSRRLAGAGVITPMHLRTSVTFLRQTPSRVQGLKLACRGHGCGDKLAIPWRKS